ncbi:MAG: 50S ribosomal protein L3 N(5)-glutamine methyltransferase [Gammaproteobacteria bacterium]|nr:50S ribosomal protein L3 N(5)-glutamine methyltransferase [Gammaproteobacteria bacterium]
MTLLTIEQKANLVSNLFNEAELSYGHGVDNGWDEAVWVVLKAINFPIESEIVDWECSLDAEQVARIDELVEKRISTRLPFAYIVNETWFAGLSFYIDQRALVPRSFLGEWVSDRFEPWLDSTQVHSILDLCTGSGCIAIACSTYFEDANVVASDVSPKALEVAQINVAKHACEHKVALNQGDLFEGINQKFDLIVCNPPYVSDERMEKLTKEYLFEPDLALRSGSDGLDFIRRLMAEAREYLNDQGFLILEAGSASFELEKAYPSIPFTWLSTEHDEVVVLIMSADELSQFFS